MSAVDTLSELLAPHVEAELRKITSAPVATIAPSPTNPRKHFDADVVAESVAELHEALDDVLYQFSLLEDSPSRRISGAGA